MPSNRYWAEDDKAISAEHLNRNEGVEIKYGDWIVVWRGWCPAVAQDVWVSFWAARNMKLGVTVISPSVGPVQILRGYEIIDTTPQPEQGLTDSFTIAKDPGTASSRKLESWERLIAFLDSHNFAPEPAPPIKLKATHQCDRCGNRRLDQTDYNCWSYGSTGLTRVS